MQFGDKWVLCSSAELQSGRVHLYFGINMGSIVYCKMDVMRVVGVQDGPLVSLSE